MSEFPLALNRLKKFNSFVLQDRVLKVFFISGEYNFLQAHQDTLLLDLISFFAAKEAGISPQNKASKKVHLSTRLQQVVALCISVFSYLFLLISRRRVLIYTADKETSATYRCDFRVENLFRYLSDCEVAYMEILHTIFRKGFIGVALRRGRPVVYLEALDVLYVLFNSLGFLGYPQLPLSSVDFGPAGEDAELFRQLVTTYAALTNRSRFRVRTLTRLLKAADVRVLLAPADTRNYNELVAACAENGIMSYGFQSGNISKYNVGYIDCCGIQSRLMKPTRFIAESNYWKEELLRLGAYFKEGDIGVGGNIKEEVLFDESGLSQGAGDKSHVTVLVPYENGAPKEEILAYIKKFLTCPGTTVVFKFRADRGLSEQARQYGLQGSSKNLTLITRLEEIDGFDIVVGTYSTFLYEMIGKLRPVLLLNSSLDYGEGLRIHNMAELLDIHDSDFCGKLLKTKFTPHKTLSDRRDRLYSGSMSLNAALDAIFAPHL